MFQLQRKYCWCLALILLPLVSGNVSLDYPSSVNYGEAFSVKLKLDNLTGIYDVRLDLLNGSDRIGKIYDTAWKSTYYYVNNAINTSISNESSFLLNITDKFAGDCILNLTLKEGSKYYRYSYNLHVDLEKERPIELTADYYKEAYSDEIIKIDINGYNLREIDYDLKVYLRWAEKDEVLSETYNEKKWKAGSYYINDVFVGPGDKSEDVEIRLKDKNITGKLIIKIKLREDDKIAAEMEKYIEIKKRPAEIIINLAENNTEESKAIILNEPKDIKTQEVWKSRTQNIAEYSIYAFVLFCTLLVFLIMRRKK